VPAMLRYSNKILQTRDSAISSWQNWRYCVFRKRWSCFKCN